MNDFLAFFARPVPLGGLVIGAYLFASAAFILSLRPRPAAMVHNIIVRPARDPDAGEPSDPETPESIAKRARDLAEKTGQVGRVDWDYCPDGMLVEAVDAARKRGLLKDRHHDDYRDFRKDTIDEVSRLQGVIDTNARTLSEVKRLVETTADRLNLLEKRAL